MKLKNNNSISDKNLASSSDNTREKSKYMSEIESKYGKDFGVKADDSLRDYLDDAGYPSLSDLLKLR